MRTIGVEERRARLGSRHHLAGPAPSVDHAAAGIASALFDRARNAGPTAWANGRVAGAWTQTDGGELIVELLEKVDAKTRKMIDTERDRLRDWLGDVRIKPRFQTPMQKEPSET